MDNFNKNTSVETIQGKVKDLGKNTQIYIMIWIRLNKKKLNMQRVI